MENEALIVDKIEDGIAVCEQEGQLVELPLARISGPVKEGDILRLQAGGLYQVDAAASAKRLEKLTARFQALKKTGL